MTGSFTKEQFYTLARELTKADGYDGWLMGSCLIKRGVRDFCDKKPDGVSFFVKTPKDGYAVITSCLNEDSAFSSMEIHIVPSGKNSTDADVKNVAGFEYEGLSPVLSRVFTPREITEFADKAGDMNPIHRTDNPVVPGLFLLEWIFECGDVAGDGNFSMRARFKTPVYAIKEVHLYKRADKNGRIRYSGMVRDADNVMREAFYAILDRKENGGVK